MTFWLNPKVGILAWLCHWYIPKLLEGAGFSWTPEKHASSSCLAIAIYWQYFSYEMPVNPLWWV